jgi:hypothetical protein
VTPAYIFGVINALEMETMLEYIINFTLWTADFLWRTLKILLIKLKELLKKAYRTGYKVFRSIGTFLFICYVVFASIWVFVLGGEDINDE